jgi:hypothetical protein
LQDNPDPRLFAQEVRNCAGGTVALGLWSAKGQRTRVLHVSVPSGPNPSLGLALQFTALATTVSNTWHVLDVAAGSPADNAGLLPYSDYVLGTPDGVLHGEGGLGELVDDHIGRPLRLWVYNHEYDVTREVEIVPSRDWGGEGALGCVLGYGALHRLPAPLHEPVSAPGETLFDGGDHPQYSAAPSPLFPGDAQSQFTTLTPQVGGDGSTFVPAAQPEAPSGDFLVPAQMVVAGGPPKAAGGAAGGRRKHGHGHSPNAMMDDYFAEQEKKSRELEGTSSKPKSTPPPPPKAGGPPRAGGIKSPELSKIISPPQAAAAVETEEEAEKDVD